ncbi:MULTISPECIES: TOMM precursor leader peptide-binding protein [unclassified Bacillus (in: firmicutes)]|uniref:TOMM precursor leader peptide-binding protein n=1 Tax=unclassified Bacillus (in: firmicutes) TaxID=185979 RepID=UPI000BF90310|nr:MULTISPECIES: TOMM precursor leader peptide-binding protein [unclassified Bacillus (in: firmicutes)]PEU19225.1 hypothetical protein CN525_08100 [Bacillus sp. AFS014408]PFW61622.1 hypothetical protein COL20_16745 [Bacillus sp. AFS075034]
MKEQCIALLGDGVFADSLKRNLDLENALYSIKSYKTVNELKDKSINLAILLDYTNVSDSQETLNYLRKMKIPFLNVRMKFGMAIVGPWESETSSGCTTCADIRLVNAFENSEIYAKYEKNMEKEKKSMSQELLPAPYIGILCEFIKKELEIVVNNGISKLISQVATIDPISSEIMLCPFLPSTDCEWCGLKIDDNKEDANICLNESQLMQDPKNLRVKKLDGELVEETYFNQKTGVIAFLGTNLNNKHYADVIAGFRLDPYTKEYGFGRGHSFTSAKISAIAEGLERMCGMRPGRKKTTVKGTYRELYEDAVHPSNFGEHEDGLYENPKFVFERFDEEKEYRWVWAYSVKKNRPILIPEQLAYFNLAHKQEKRFVYEISNGCAVGGTLEEAILHGIFETVERDAFLTTWYAQLPLPELDINSLRSTKAKFLLERITSLYDYDVRLFNMTNDIGIPSIMTVAQNKKEGDLQVLCASASNLRVELAVEGALKELGPLIPHYQGRIRNEYTNALEMHHNPEKVIYMEDHAFVNGIKESVPRFDFLLNRSQKLSSIEETFASVETDFDMSSNDMIVILKNVVSRILDANLDIMVIKQTTPELEKTGLHAVKVLIPGMIPMTFGHSLKRIRGLKRLLGMPMLLGYKNRKLEYEELNPYPHPFP